MQGFRLPRPRPLALSDGWPPPSRPRRPLLVVVAIRTLLSLFPWQRELCVGPCPWFASLRVCPAASLILLQHFVSESCNKTHLSGSCATITVLAGRTPVVAASPLAAPSRGAHPAPSVLTAAAGALSRSGYAHVMNGHEAGMGLWGLGCGTVWPGFIRMAWQGWEHCRQLVQSGRRRAVARHAVVLMDPTWKCNRIWAWRVVASWAVGSTQQALLHRGTGAAHVDALDSPDVRQLCPPRESGWHATHTHAPCVLLPLVLLEHHLLLPPAPAAQAPAPPPPRWRHPPPPPCPDPPRRWYGSMSGSMSGGTSGSGSGTGGWGRLELGHGDVVR